MSNAQISGSEPSAELSFHLATAENELSAGLRTLEDDSSLFEAITGVIGAIKVIREAL